MSKTDDLLRACIANLGKWTCAYCGSGSGQPAATFRELKKLGYKFEEVSPNRWAKEDFCPRCGDYRTHYKLLSATPEFVEKPRVSINGKTRERILLLFDRRDAFTGASITSVPEIDHKMPWTRMEQDIDASTLTNTQIRQHFQLLTREHNLLKDRACGSCKNTNKRPPLFDIPFCMPVTRITAAPAKNADGTMELNGAKN